MVPILTTAQMRELDRQAIAGDTSVGYAFMLKAGAALAEEAKRMVTDPSAGDIAVICGKGNNGGDGYVAVSLLMDAGYRTMCFSLCDEKGLTAEAKLAFNDYVSRKGNLLVVDDASDLENLGQYVLIIDAILGTGIKGNPHSISAEVIDVMNQCGVPILAADTPSGLDNDSGRCSTPCVRATRTLCMGYPKVGQFFHPGRIRVGQIAVADLGYPSVIMEQHNMGLYYPVMEDLRALLPARRPAGSKFDHGQVLMVAGSRGLTGSTTLASLAALCTGCGMVHVAVPTGIMGILGMKTTEPVFHSMPQTTEGSLSLDAYGRIMELSERMQCVCIGPGLSHNAQTSALVRKLVANIKAPIVLDADGINAFKGYADELAHHKSELILTPHAGEWERVFGGLSGEPIEMIAQIRRVATTVGATMLYKGSPTVVAHPRGRAYLLPYGTSALAKAGTGDVLSGIISSLVAQGCGGGDGATLGAFMHGRAGEIAAEELTDYCVLAGDVIDTLPAVVAQLLG